MKLGFQSAVLHLCQQAYNGAITEDRMQRPLFRAKENPAKHFL